MWNESTNGVSSKEVFSLSFSNMPLAFSKIYREGKIQADLNETGQRKYKGGHRPYEGGSWRAGRLQRSAVPVAQPVWAFPFKKFSL